MRPAALVLLFLMAMHLPTSHVNADDDSEDYTFFEKKIRPVLIQHCYKCHSAKAVESGDLAGGLQLDTRVGIRQGGDSGPAVVPGKPGQSLLLAALRHEQNLEMPPSGRLSSSIIEDVQAWIETGAPDPRNGRPVAAGVNLEQARTLWSLQPVTIPEVPAAADETWPRGPIDRFVAARREAANLPVAGDASPRVLIRRLFFDLIGLPPTREELTQFEGRSAEEVVDYLLESPHFGERWGRHWLDVARYAESNGRARNMAWHHAWRYRDWVIAAFNRDMPYDKFLRHQIAGDLLPASDSAERDQQIIATGFLALGPKSLEERNRELFRMDTIDEQIDVISRGILGLSVSCARCHDHKFDPIPTADYYSLAGILGSTETLYGIGPMGIKGVNDSALAPIGPRADEYIAAATEHLEAVKQQTQKRNTARSDRYRVVRRVADAKRRLAGAGADKQNLEEEIAAMEAEIADWDDRIQEMDAVLADLVGSPPPQPEYAMGAREAEIPEDCRIRIRGEPANYGEPVPRGVPRAISVNDLAPVSQSESGRLQLAQWLSSPQNPLTPRVMVNRVWLHLFGRGLVDTPDDFGATGSPPSHPLLLDYLAAQFIRQDWSVKRLIREIVLSRTYQLSGNSTDSGIRRDPDNVLLWRMRVRRLEAEPFRDALLAVSGRLNREQPTGSPVQKIGIFSDYEFNSRTTLTAEMIRTDHRTVYVPVVRGSLPELLELFDFADPNALTGQRNETTVPAQALFLMNSPTIVELASLTAERLLAHQNFSDRDRIQWLFETSLARAATESETDAIMAYLDADQELQENIKTDSSPDDHQRQAWISICQSILASTEFRHIR